MRRALPAWLGIVPWLLLIVWFLLPTLAVIDQMGRGGPVPPDLATYLQAAERLRNNIPLYLTPAGAQKIWLAIHALERANYLVNANAAVAANIPGPYIYPPALAVWLYWLRLSPTFCMGLLYLAVIGFCGLWLYTVRAPRGATGKRPDVSNWWLLLVIGSWTILCNITTTGNIEPLLLLVTLLAAWALWHGQALLSVPLLTFVVLIKPFLALFFVAFALLILVNPARPPRATLDRLLTAALLALLLGAISITLWGRTLWLPTLAYIRHALDYHWFVLPVAQQTPLSIWNRTPLQGLVNWGVEPHLAQQLAWGLWGLALVLTVALCRGRPLTFALTFALALILFYVGRPVGWGFHFLEIVVMTATWGELPRFLRLLLLIATLALMSSHWLALLWTLQGVWLRLVTLQSAELPWEAWLAPLVAWCFLIVAARSVVTEKPMASPALVEQAS